MSNTTTRIRLTKNVVSSRAEAERVLGEIAADTASLNAQRAQLDQELTAVRQRFEGSIDTLAKQIEQKSGLLQQWAEASPEEFTDKKSVDFLHGRVGFRTGTPKLKTLAGWTWGKVLDALTPAFVRTKREPDKDALLSAYSRNEIDDTALRAAGLRVTQDEAFFVEPKLEDGNT